MTHPCDRVTVMSETELNAMQQAVLEALGKEPNSVPIPREVIEGIRT